MSRLSFKLEQRCSTTQARAARFQTLHNEVLTPLFMPVGTYGSVRHVRTPDLLSTGSQILLANTYHLLLRPGPEVFEKFKGIHNFMKWPKSVLTDSGGYQIFSLPHSRRITEEGAKFQSYLNGDMHLLTPELSIGTQRSIGSDIMMALDVCVPSTSEYAVAVDAMDRTHRWAERSLAARGDSPQSLFGIVQGACYEDLRRKSASAITSLPFDGYAIGGLAVGETKAEREDFCGLTASLLPEDRPRYLMGVGTPIDLLEAVARGVDMFDCIIPTALAEQGVAYTFTGLKKLVRGVYKFSEEPIEEGCPCEACTHYSRAYLHHLVKRKEPYIVSLISLHNITFYHRLMRRMREEILAGTFAGFYARTREELVMEDSAYPMDPPRRKKRKDRILELGNFQITELHGKPKIQDKASGEIMHRSPEPDVEAYGLYVESTGLKDKLSSPGTSENTPLVIWDLGLGSAHNAMACIKAAEELRAEGKLYRPLEIYSFERDMDALRLAWKRRELFYHLRHQGPEFLLVKGEWFSDRIRWKLIEGDFREKISLAPAPDFIFFDPFSAKTNPESWTFEFLQKIFAGCRDKESTLVTYSQSTAFRAALLAAGFFVAKGKTFGPQSESTLGFTQRPSAGESLLTHDWLGRWQRSDNPNPSDVSNEFLAEFGEKIQKHAQFTL